MSPPPWLLLHGASPDGTTVAGSVARILIGRGCRSGMRPQREKQRWWEALRAGGDSEACRFPWSHPGKLL